jgi:hypothetical protein
MVLGGTIWHCGTDYTLYLKLGGWRHRFTVNPINDSDPEGQCHIVPPKDVVGNKNTEGGYNISPRYGIDIELDKFL